jgi:hypothetical protein
LFDFSKKQRLFALSVAGFDFGLLGSELGVFGFFCGCVFGSFSSFLLFDASFFGFSFVIANGVDGFAVELDGREAS